MNVPTRSPQVGACVALTRWFSIIVITLAVLFLQTARAQGLALTAAPTQLTNAGDLSVSLGYVTSPANPTNRPVDLYVALRLPGAPGLFFFPDFSTTPSPWIRGWSPQPVTPSSIFSHRFTGSEPEGDYQFFAAMLDSASGALVGEVVSAATRLLRAQGVISSSPAEGATVPISPIFTVGFSDAVDLNSVLDHSEVIVTSQQSGKIATLYTGNWFGTQARLVRLNYPNGTIITSKLSEGTMSLVSFKLSEDGKTLSLPFQPVTIQDTTFSLASGGRYTFSIKFLSGARLSNGYSLAGSVVGPIGFSVQ